MRSTGDAARSKCLTNDPFRWHAARARLGDTMPARRGRYNVHIDGKWSLEDLYIFPRTYEQIYYAWQTFGPSDDDITEDRIARAFHIFPWQGGYSAVNFYNQLKYITPARQRPQIISIQYGSPGAIELQLAVSLAKDIAGAVMLISGSIIACNKAYHDVYTGMQKRELLRIKNEKETIELVKKHRKFLEESAHTMMEILSVPDAIILGNRTESDLLTTKILLSLFRRIRTLAEFQNRGKVDFGK